MAVVGWTLGESRVNSVNGNQPDSNGDVFVTADDMGAVGVEKLTSVLPAGEAGWYRFAKLTGGSYMTSGQFSIVYSGSGFNGTVDGLASLSYHQGLSNINVLSSSQYSGEGGLGIYKMRIVRPSGYATGEDSFLEYYTTGNGGDSNIHIKMVNTATRGGSADNWKLIDASTPGSVPEGFVVEGVDVAGLGTSGDFSVGKKLKLGGIDYTSTAPPLKTVNGVTADATGDVVAGDKTVMVATVPNVTGWYRIAKGVAGIYVDKLDNAGAFRINTESANANYQNLDFQANNYFNKIGRCITQICDATNNTNTGVSKLRIVYHPTDLMNSEIFLEMYMTSDGYGADTTVTLTNNQNWELISPDTAGGIPADYESLEYDVVRNGSGTTGDFVADGYISAKGLTSATSVVAQNIYVNEQLFAPSQSVVVVLGDAGGSNTAAIPLSESIYNFARVGIVIGQVDTVQRTIFTDVTTATNCLSGVLDYTIEGTTITSYHLSAYIDVGGMGLQPYNGSASGNSYGAVVTTEMGMAPWVDTTTVTTHRVYGLNRIYPEGTEHSFRYSKSKKFHIVTLPNGQQIVNEVPYMVDGIQPPPVINNQLPDAEPPVVPDIPDAEPKNKRSRKKKSKKVEGK